MVCRLLPTVSVVCGCRFMGLGMRFISKYLSFKGAGMPTIVPDTLNPTLNPRP